MIEILCYNVILPLCIGCFLIGCLFNDRRSKPMNNPTQEQINAALKYQSEERLKIIDHLIEFPETCRNCWTVKTPCNNCILKQSVNK